MRIKSAQAGSGFEGGEGLSPIPQINIEAVFEGAQAEQPRVILADKVIYPAQAVGGGFTAGNLPQGAFR